MMRRPSISIKLIPGEDDELIRWWDNLPRGERSTTIKAHLRELCSKQSTPDPLASIRGELAAIRKMLAQGIVLQQPTTQIEAAPALSQAQLTERSRKLMKAEW